MVAAFCVSLFGLAATEFSWDFYNDERQGWVEQSGCWSGEEDALTCKGPEKRGGLAGRPGLIFDDVLVEADLCIADVLSDAETNWAGLLVRATNPVANGAWHDGYQFFIRANGQVELQRADGTLLGSVATRFHPRETTVRLKLAVKGKQFTAYVNEERLFEAEDGACAQGEIALMCFGNVTAFDNVKVSGNQIKNRVEPLQPIPVRRTPVEPLPRLAVDNNGFFIKATDERFIPRGFNHTVLDKHWHATFNTNVYRHDAMENVLNEMHQLGANVIRVWIWGRQDETGFTGGKPSRGLSGAYMENVVDFLRLATQCQIYAIPILDETPHNACYDALMVEPAHEVNPDVGGYNRQYLAQGPIAAKRTAITDFITYIKASDPGLLNTVLSWSLANEVFVNYTDAPFSLEEGEALTANGKRYDITDKDQRQACYDEGIVHWANQLVSAIKKIDPEALVTAGMWTTDVCGRPPVNGLINDGKDPRVPSRPSALGGPNSLLDFIDVHIYPWDGTSKVRPGMHERDLVKKPAIVGEYGVFKDKTPDHARTMLREMLEQAYAIGYHGDLFWIWNLVGVPGQTWSAVEEDLGGYVMQLPRK
ncbi:MAG TPA: hypothetical protein PLI09_08800 [Candidatus Hydrogenedentes bacterium]|nr:hypothetical protein [Candidatus Hydrogenedentota bacterium]